MQMFYRRTDSHNTNVSPSYIHRRYITLDILDTNDTKSSNENIDCGIPQGSCLGPLLFLMYINQTTLFADDAYLCWSGPGLRSQRDKVAAS